MLNTFTEKPEDVRCVAAELYFIPVKTRVPLKFGHETLSSVTCARVKLTVVGRDGRTAIGWGETPISVQWVWPGNLTYDERHRVLLDFCQTLTAEWARFGAYGHPLTVGYRFQREKLPALLAEVNASRDESRKMPLLAALVCCSAFDIALHDAYGVLHNLPIYETYGRQHMNSDLSAFLEPAAGAKVCYTDVYPEDLFVKAPPTTLPAWHLVGGLDRIRETDPGTPCDDGYPTLLSDWIQRDGLTCLKIKLKGNDTEWDRARILDTGKVALENGVLWLTADFNCTVHDPAYVNAILDWLLREHSRVYGMILYVEQPFPYEIEEHPIDVHSVSARKPLFMDESAHDWQMVRLGRSLGWTGVALKTCKTQTGAVLSACFALTHGMTLMVQDLTNPMLAMIPHAQLAARVGTIMGVETNAPQFYPDASNLEALVHPGLYRRRNGVVDLSSLRGAGFGYRVDEIGREIGVPVCSAT